MATACHDQSCQCHPILISDDSRDSIDVIDFVTDQETRSLLDFINNNPGQVQSMETSHRPVTRQPPELVARQPPEFVARQPPELVARHPRDTASECYSTSNVAPPCYMSNIPYVTTPEDSCCTSSSQSNHKKRGRLSAFPAQLGSPAKRSRRGESERRQSFIVKGKEMRAFFSLLDDPQVGAFLSRDSCRKVADKYLLAMTFVYFKRAGFSVKEYNRMNFFLALYLANDMEEDENDGKYEIFPWALGSNWHAKYPAFIRKRDKLWRRLGYRAMVSRKCCEEVIAIEPTSPFWRRERPLHHGGAIRDHMKSPDDDGYPRGPDSSPRPCTPCNLQQYDSASPDSENWYISTTSDSSPGSPYRRAPVKPSNRFDMDGLKDTLDEFSIWAHGSEE